MSMRRQLGIMLVVVVMAGLVVSCSRGPDVEEDPRGALREALSRLGDYDGWEVTYRFAADDTARARLAAEEDVDPAVLDVFLGAALHQRYIPGDPDDLGDDRTSLSMEVDGREVFALVALPDYETYVRVDLPAIVDLVREHGDAEVDDADLAELEAQARAFDLADEYAVLEAGGWFHLTGLEQLSNLAAGMAGTAQPDEDELQELQQQLLDTFRDHFDDLEIAYLGADDAGERLRVTADAALLRSLVQSVFPTLVSATGLDQFGEDPQELTDELVAEIPDDAAVSVDVWLDGGDVRQVAFDILGAIRQAGEDVPDGEFLVVAEIREYDGGIDAPADAYRLDLFGLFGRFMGGAFGGLGGFDDTDPWDAGPDAADTDFEDLFAEECIDEEEIEFYLGALEEEERELALEEFEALTGRERC